MSCLKICNYTEGAYCCDQILNMSMKKKRCESAFFMVCLQRHAIEKMVQALVEGKQIVDTNGKCLFCRNQRAHEVDQWCTRKTKTQLYLSRLPKDEEKIDRLLEKYLTIRVNNKMNDLKRSQEGVIREMREGAAEEGMIEEETIHMVARQARLNRKAQREEMERLDEENEQIRDRMARKLLQKKEETIQMLQDHAAPTVVPEFTPAATPEQ